MVIRWEPAPLRVALVKPGSFAKSGLTWKPVGAIEAHSFAAFDSASGTVVIPHGISLGPGEDHVSQTLVPVKQKGVYHLIFEYEREGKEREAARRELVGTSSRTIRIWDLGFVIVRDPPEDTETGVR